MADIISRVSGTLQYSATAQITVSSSATIKFTFKLQSQSSSTSVIRVSAVASNSGVASTQHVTTSAFTLSLAGTSVSVNSTYVAGGSTATVKFGTADYKDVSVSYDHRCLPVSLSINTFNGTLGSITKTSGAFNNPSTIWIGDTRDTSWVGEYVPSGYTELYDEACYSTSSGAAVRNTISYKIVERQKNKVILNIHVHGYASNTSNKTSNLWLWCGYGINSTLKLNNVEVGTINWSTAWGNGYYIKGSYAAANNSYTTQNYWDRDYNNIEVTVSSSTNSIPIYISASNTASGSYTRWPEKSGTITIPRFASYPRVKVSGQWKSGIGAYFKVNGQWKEITTMYRKDGSWKEIIE